ncbi:winged helix-turn-helix transcriptional regulator [uncultured Sulfitobacter sp.]|uniref:winged helix-turn-helix transcriptional regulator n=1 Tax=uncultured Sulfitobacter sp. TaxID=191468 RepID=UPI0026181D61|nr:winged helix-turn-helix transcriptional regulator [uncultured Sulfitobacter sp.]
MRKETGADLYPELLVVAMIGGRWRLSIFQILIFNGTERFGALLKSVRGITQTMLTKQLRGVENDGCVHREVYAEVPPRVEYSGTEDAIRLMSAFEAMHRWWETRTATSTKFKA